MKKEVRSSINPLNWWKDRKAEYPILSSLARQYLGISSTSVPSERLSSNVNNHITSKRNRLDPKVIENFVFLKRNMPLLDSIFPKS